MEQQSDPDEKEPRDVNRRPHISWVDRIEYAVRSRGAKVVVLALVANTMVAQLLYNSAGQLVLSSAFLLGYLLFSAVCSTVAFALFEVSTIFQLHDLHTLDASIKEEIGADKLIKRGYLVLVVSSLINFLSILYSWPWPGIPQRGAAHASRWIICLEAVRDLRLMSGRLDYVKPSDPPQALPI